MSIEVEKFGQITITDRHGILDWNVNNFVFTNNGEGGFSPGNGIRAILSYLNKYYDRDENYVN